MKYPGRIEPNAAFVAREDGLKLQYLAIDLAPLGNSTCSDACFVMRTRSSMVERVAGAVIRIIVHVFDELKIRAGRRSGTSPTVSI